MSGNMDCFCCGHSFMVGDDEESIHRREVTERQRQENGPEFLGFIVCDDCVDHEDGDCNLDNDCEDDCDFWCERCDEDDE